MHSACITDFTTLPFIANLFIRRLLRWVFLFSLFACTMKTPERSCTNRKMKISQLLGTNSSIHTHCWKCYIVFAHIEWNEREKNEIKRLLQSLSNYYTPWFLNTSSYLEAPLAHIEMAKSRKLIAYCVYFLHKYLNKV